MTNRVPLIVNSGAGQIQELPLTDVLSVAGNITAGNVTTVGLFSATGNVTGSYILGNGSQLTGIVSSYGNANVVANLAALGSNPVSTTGNVTGGNILTSGLMSSTGNATHGNLLTGGLVSATGNVTGNFFVGNGSALTGIVTSSSSTTYTSTQTFNGSTSTPAMKVTNIVEPAVLTAAAPAATTNFYLNSGAVQYYTANANANFTLNFAFSSGTTMNAALSTNDTTSCTLIVTNGASAYYPSAFQVDGSSSNVSVKWQGGTAPSSGDASAVDSYGFVIIKTGSAAYTILASQTKFA